MPTATQVRSARTFLRLRSTDARVGWQVLEQVARDGAPPVQRGSRPLVQRVRAVRVEHLVEVLPQLDEAVREALAVLDVHVVVARAVHQQQMTPQSFCEIDGGAATESLGVVLG